MKKKDGKKLAIYQTREGALCLRHDFDNETVWANSDQIAMLFNRDKSVISRHIKNIFKEKELDKKMVIAFFATTTQHGAIKGKTQTKQVAFYNLDMIISIGYRVNSKIATQFRIWATKTLKEHITKGFTINLNRIEKNHQAFLKAVEDIEVISKNSTQIGTNDVLELIKSFSYTWFSLQSYDQTNFPKKGSKKVVKVTAEELIFDLQKLKQELIRKKEATEFFAEEKQKDSLAGIVGNIFQSIFGKDVYQTVEEKAAHLLYFITKNHPFNDGNKRSGAFAFVWFLQKADINFKTKISPETLATLTIFIAESNPKDKEKMIGIILLLLNSQK
jgi:death-on-curing family protein